MVFRIFLLYVTGYMLLSTLNPVLCRNLIYASQPEMIDLFDSDEETYKSALDAQDMSDTARALILFDHLIQNYPQSQYLEDAKQHKDNILKTLQNQYSQDAYYKKINSLIQTNQLYPAFELGKNLISSYPPEKLFADTKSLLKESVSSQALRFKIHFVSSPESSLVFSGTKESSGIQYLVFTFGNRTFYKKTGDCILFYKIIRYDDLTGTIELKPITDLPCRLLQNNNKETFIHFATRISNIQQNLTYRAYFFLDCVETKTGAKIPGICTDESEDKIFVDYPVGKTTMRLNADKNKVDQKISFSTADTKSVFEKKFDPSNNGQPLYLAQMRYYIDSKQYSESLLKYFSITDNPSITEQDKSEVISLYGKLQNEIIGLTLPQRLLAKANYLADNNYFYSGFTELDYLITNYPSDDCAVKAQNLIIGLAKKPDNNLYITSISSIPFPFTFMGYTKMSESEEIYQINYKKNSFFLSKGQSHSGYKFIKTEEKTVEIYNPDLNVSSNQLVRWLIVEPETTRVIRLKQNESYSDNDKIYVEMQDRLTGKIYPGYILSDSLKTAGGESAHGFVKEDKLNKEIILFDNVLSDKYRIFKQNDVADINRNSFFDKNAFSDIEKFLGLNIISGLKKYYTLDIITQSAIQPPENEGHSVTPPDKSAQLPPPKKKVQKLTETEKVTLAEKKVSKNNVSHKQNIQNDEIKIREAKLKLKRRVIKLLGLFILLWLIYIAYKLFRIIKY